jgi:putative ABC transport system permease protein
VNTVGRIRDGVTPEQARTELRGIADRLAAEFPSNSPARTAALLPLHETVVGDVRRALLVLLGAVGLVLLIACANVANLLIARGATRSDEMAVRAALGAGRRRIFSQLMTESVLLAVTGGSAGVALAAAGVQALKALSPGQIPRLDEVGLDATAVLFALAISLLTALLFGLAPAFQLIRTPLAGTLRQDANRTLGSRRGIGRAALLAAEVALSLVLLVGAGLLLRSFASMQRIDTGYTTDEIAHISLSLPGVSYATPDDAVRFFDTLEERLEVLPGIDEVALVVGAPLSDFAYWTAFTRDDLPPPAPGDGLSASLRIVDEDFLPTMGIALVEGRPFVATDRHAAMRVALINQELARYAFGDVDPIGKQITMGLNAGYLEDQPRTVVGIVEDVRTSSLTGEVDPELYIPFAQAGSSFATVLMRPRGTAQSALADARGAVHALDANLPIRDPGTMRQLLDRHTARPRFYLQLLALFAGLAIALAAVGLYGVVAYLVAQRSREIGVRIALGASTADVMRLVVQQGFGPAVLGAVIGLCAAFAGGRVMSSLLFDVKATDPLTFAGTTAILLGIAFIACVVPAGRATRISPASALKAER